MTVESTKYKHRKVNTDVCEGGGGGGGGLGTMTFIYSYEGILQKITFQGGITYILLHLAENPPQAITTGRSLS